MQFKRFLVLILVCFLALPSAGQQFPRPFAPGSPVSQAHMARLNSPQAPAPGRVAPAMPAAGQAEPPAEKEESPPGNLQIEVLEGEGAQNDIQAGVAVAPRVRVTDEAGNPVPNAEVVFSLPMGGPSGLFSGWVRTQTVRTDEDGVAAATAYTPNEIEGRFNIKVTATAGGRRGSIVISQSNVRGRKAKSSKKWVWWVVAAGAAAGIVAGVAAGGGEDVPPGQQNPVTITPGPISVGGPR